MERFDEKTPRVGYVVKRYPRYSETFIVNEILAHEAAGLDVEIFSLRPPEDTHFQDTISRVRAPVNYLPYGGVKGMDLWAAFEEAAGVIPGFFSRLEAAAGEEARDVYHAAVLSKLLRVKGITHIHAHFATSSTTVARLASRFTGIPYSFTAHAKDIFHEEVSPEDLEKKLKDAAAVVTVSDYNVEYLSERYPASASKIRRVYNGLDLERFAFKSPEKREPLIVAVGRLVEKKGFSDLVEACKVLSDGAARFRCRIIGAGELEQQLRERITALGLEGIVELTGPRPQREIIEEIQGASVFAAPCVVGADGNRDGLPTVLLEAMALGTPVVSTDVTGIPEIIRDGQTGLMVPQNDPGGLAESIKMVLEDPALGGRLISRARRLVEEKFDVHANAAVLRGLFGSGPVQEKTFKIAREVC